MNKFIHLHCHSHYSLLDGASTIESLIDATILNKMDAVALTDHGVMFGAIEFYKKAKKKGINPIVGSEFYIVTKGSRFDKGSSKDEKISKPKIRYHHIVLLAKNEIGYKNLLKLSSIGHTEGFYYKPRIDFEILSKYKNDIIALSACAGGVVSAHIANNDIPEAIDVAKMYQQLFGDDFYLEINNHDFEVEKNILIEVPKIAKDLKIKLVATNDVHYIKPQHAIAHNILLNIPEATSTYSPDYQKLRYGTDKIYFKSADEMVELFKNHPEAIASTLEIAEKCKLELDLKKNFMPNFPFPPEAKEKTVDELLERLVFDGLKNRYENLTEKIISRAKHELSVIEKMGYAGYFLIVWDFIKAAREMNVLVGPGRGSAAGSIVSYALKITSVEPLKYGLLFERFLNPDRISMPDIDIDFSDKKRELVINYVKNKYGNNSVSQIITFGTLSSRAVLKDVGRVLGIPLSYIENLTKQIPVNQGKVLPLAESIEVVPDLIEARKNGDDKVQLLLDTSLVLEGMTRNSSTHAAGIVIAPGELTDYVPMYKTPSTDLMTQFTMKDLEDAGLLKMDFLGLRTLTVIEDCIDLIFKNHNIKIDIDSIPDDDKKTFEIFRKAETVGIFQFESPGMQDWLRKLKPTSINDLTAMNALYRPGPMENIGEFIKRKHGIQKIEYIHPKLENILKETYGVIVYQEQVMIIANEIAGFSLAKSDNLRRAMGKKDKVSMAALKFEFVEGAIKTNTCKAKLAEEIFDLIEKFASYGFNKSHSVAYSVLAYQTAYLKAHFPNEYMASILSSEIGNTDKIVLFIDQTRSMGIKVLPPDVNESFSDFTITNEGIRFGLSAIKNVGEAAVLEIIKERNKNGKFKSLLDFCTRNDLRVSNKKTLEGLLLSGSFDTVTKNRAELFATLEPIMNKSQIVKEHLSSGQDDIFGESKNEIEIKIPQKYNVWSEMEILSKEKEMLGFYVSGHPLLKYKDEIKTFATLELGDVEGKKSGTYRVGGIIASIKKKIDKKGRQMAFVTIEDFSGKAECIIFSDAYKKYSDILIEEAMIMVDGKVEINETSVKIIVENIMKIEEVKEKFAKKIFIKIDMDEVSNDTLLELKNVLSLSKGSCSCYFNVTGKEYREKVFHLNNYNINPTNDLITNISSLVGRNSIKFTT